VKEEPLEPDESNSQTRARVHPALPLSFSAIALFILLVRFPPADLVGWIAGTLGTTIGVPVLFSASLLFVSYLMLKRGEYWSALRVALLVLSGASAVLGLFLVFATP
jgi:hypothetical protein